MSVQFNKNGVVSMSSFSDAAPVLDMETKVLSDGSVWARIHWLNVSTTKEWFANAAEVTKCVNKDNRYSRMGIVDLFQGENGKYEFMLTYPSLSSILYNRWTQTSSPNASSVTGFTAITTAWSTHNAGIRRPNIGSTIYNCDTGSTWFAAIGQTATWTSTQYIPAADGSSQTSTELWVRTDTVPKQTLLKLYDNFISSKDFIEI